MSDARATLEGILNYREAYPKVQILVSEEYDAIREVLDENERLRTEVLYEQERNAMNVKVLTEENEQLRAKIDAALAIIKVRWGANPVHASVIELVNALKGEA